MTGRWYAVGVGPGDPELMTIKAVKRLKACDTLAVPHENRDQCVAYRIAVQAVPELAKKKCICLPMPMTKNKALLEESHREAVKRTEECLRQGENVAFITLGDTTVYSTCLYIKERLDEKQYATELINGIPSFCAAAARMGIPLVNGKEELHIIPASYQIGDALKQPGVKVLMKSGKKLSEVMRLLAKQDCDVRMVENCGMESEKIYGSIREIPEEAGYYSLLIVRDMK